MEAVNGPRAEGVEMARSGAGNGGIEDVGEVTDLLGVGPGGEAVVDVDDGGTADGDSGGVRADKPDVARRASPAAPIDAVTRLHFRHRCRADAAGIIQVRS